MCQIEEKNLFGKTKREDLVFYFTHVGVRPINKGVLRKYNFWYQNKTFINLSILILSLQKT